MTNREYETMIREITTTTPTVYPMRGRTGNPVANQYVSHVNGAYVFQSYNVRIAAFDLATRTLILGLNWDYSVTTQKYLWQFIRNYTTLASVINAHGKRTGAQNIRAAIDAGEIVYLKGWE